MLLKQEPQEDDQEDDGEPPKDEKNIAYIIFLIFGIGALLPWNAVLSAMPYFEE